MTNQHVPEIMECTLRDGSYVINFNFTAADTRAITAALDGVGFKLIEVGHGVGLGASDKGYGQAAETDETYMKAAAESVKDSQWGMFCIPGIAEVDQVNMAADHGMDFIRIGTNVEDVPDSQAFIERAQKHGIRVYANFMKSYATEPKEFVKAAKLSASYGAETVYVVDSAGGMFPDDVRAYVSAVKDSCDVGVGFHGHDNLGLSVANAMAATEAGADIIDTSLQGFGRSSGNTPTEQWLCVLDRQGAETGLDALSVMDVADHYIMPLITERGISSLDMVCGLAQFHSSYMGVIRKYSSEYSIDPRRLIIDVCAENKVEAPADLVEKKAQALSAQQHDVDSAITPRFHFERYFGREQE